VRRIWFVVAFAIFVSPLGSIRSESKMQPVQSQRAPLIDRFYEDAKGNLHIVFTDGKDLAVPKEKGRYEVAQEGFENILIAKSKRRVGWLASYMVCAQSYPCTPELAIFENGKIIQFIKPVSGVIWNWSFIRGGDRVAIQYGFPHGDEVGAFALHDAVSGKKISEYSQIGKRKPDWVQELESSNK
jgi:hypothetical protein